jgi:hypothetical protein
VDVPRSDILFRPKVFTKGDQELAVAQHFLGLYVPHIESSAIQHGPYQTPAHRTVVWRDRCPGVSHRCLTTAGMQRMIVSSQQNEELYCDEQ